MPIEFSAARARNRPPVISKAVHLVLETLIAEAKAEGELPNSGERLEVVREPRSTGNRPLGVTCDGL